MLHPLDLLFPLPVLATFYEPSGSPGTSWNSARRMYELIYFVFVGKMMIRLKITCSISLTKAVLDIDDTGAMAPI